MTQRRAVLSVRKQSDSKKKSFTLADVIGQVAELPALSAIEESLHEHQQVTVEGVWPGALSPLAATLVDNSDDRNSEDKAPGNRAADAKGAAQESGRQPGPLLIITSQVAEAETVAGEVAELLGRECLVFPPGTEETELESLAQQETAGRLRVLSHLYNYDGTADRPVIATTLPALMQAVPKPQTLEGDKQLLKVGGRIRLKETKAWLEKSGYHATSAVQLPGEYAHRGGILDVYPPDESLPVRIELFDDEIESLRTFDIVSQRSIERRQELQLLAADGSVTQDGTLVDYLPPDALVITHELRAILAAAEAFLARVPFPDRFESPASCLESLGGFKRVFTAQLADEGYSGQLVQFPLRSVERLGGDLERLAADIDAECGKRPVVVSAINEGEQERLTELLASSDAAKAGRINIVVSQLQTGFEIPKQAFVLTAGQLLRRTHVRRITRRTKSKPIDTFSDLRQGDLVVHLSHGIGVYRGTELLEKNGQRFEHLVLEFDGGTKIFVPSSKIELVQRYVGGTKSRPKLAKIGGAAWARQRKAAERAVQDMAVELLELQARRNSQPGIAFADDSVWQNQFDASFSYVETPDQLSAIDAVKGDMLRSRPMDRLICGDVGFGKTEVAMRAAFKAIDSGYQVAVLVPTTVLAEQHFKTFRERMAEFPFDIEKLSRFATNKEQKETLKGIASGRVDIVVGTHRIASKDMKFYNLGLLIIDEEQRFGVEIKERLKHLRANVDVLTLSATPIPRTLHMSLVGVRDISNLETAPEDRLSVETRTIRFNEEVIRNAILRELNRGGQIYFVHNRVQDIEEVAFRIKQIVPEASLVIGHGQMAEGELEKVMVDFIDHKYDILLATTIIESGLDIPNANTIFIDEANRYGLAELHQLRGRVGRYKNQAYCYLLIDKHKHLSPDASRRLHAIEEYSEIGAGFGIAMRDLEIRGAGNLLGTQQSGHIAAVGYELYCQLLGSAVRELTHQAPELTVDVDVDIPVQAFLPLDYVPELRQRIDIYRRLSRIADVSELDDIRDELNDRFGRLPKPVKNLLLVAEMKIDASIWFVKSLTVADDYLVMTYANRERINHLAKLHDGRLRVVDSQKAYWLADPDKTGRRINWLQQARQAFRSA